MSYFYYDDDRYWEARDFADEEDFEKVAVECADCGHAWDPGYYPATRWEPACEANPECPLCGSNNRRD